MATIEVGTFQQFKMTTEEEKQAAVLPPLTQIRLHNMRCMIAHTQLNIRLDTKDHLKNVQEHAYLAGKLDLLNELLEIPEVSTNVED